MTIKSDIKGTIRGHVLKGNKNNLDHIYIYIYQFPTMIVGNNLYCKLVLKN